jgi:Ca2+-binding RTX toxin-like protein
VINGLGGSDIVRGGPGEDEVGGGYGADIVYGGRGDDTMIDHPDEDRDVMRGGRGNDNVQVRDFPAVRDVVDCGPGDRDIAYVDRLDVVEDCEKVSRR